MNEIFILIVEDSPSDQKMLERQLIKWGHHVILAENGEAALCLLERNHVDMVLSDQSMPGMSGLKLLEKVKMRYPGLPFIMLTANGSIHDAVSAIHQGASDYLEKPLNPEKLQIAIEKTIQINQLSTAHQELQNYFKKLHGFENIITRSNAMFEAIELANRVKDSKSTPIFVSGESGTGKEMLSRAIHAASESMESRFIGVNCASIPASLLEAELFGYAKGAFTGALKDYEGKFGFASGGTLLLDEIGDMPVDLQAKLLRVLQDRTYQPLGSNRTLQIKCRIICTSNKDLARLVASRMFREDLFHRIYAFPIHLPPLRDRKSDIPLLSEHFISEFRTSLGKKIPGITRAAMERLLSYQWPGNVRELKNCIERAAILIDDAPIGSEQLMFSTLPPNRKPPPDNGPTGSRMPIHLEFDEDTFSLDAVIEKALEVALQKCGHNKSRAAKMLKINRKIFYRRNIG